MSARDIDKEDARHSARAGDLSSSAAADVSFRAVAEEVFPGFARNWKPMPFQVNCCDHRNRILHWFRERLFGAIFVRNVRHWYASLHNTPFAADRSSPILPVIKAQAEILVYRPDEPNPCWGIRCNGRQVRKRFLTVQE